MQKDISNKLPCITDLPGSSGFHQATDYIINKFNESNFDLHIEKYPLDGKRKVLGRTYSFVWEPISVELKLISPVEEELITFEKVPSCLPWWSGSTPYEGIMAELIDVGHEDSPACYKDKDVHGKVVLIETTPNFSSFREAWRLAVEEYGAIGIIADIMLYQAPPLKTRQMVPDLVQLLRISPPKIRDQWALSISHTIGQQLRRLLHKGPVKIWTRIQAKTFKGEAKNLTVTIPGTDTTDEEILFISHTSAGTKPGANCASGPALMFEIVRTIKTLIDTGKIPRLRRSIKFQIGHEGNVSYEYLSELPHPDGRSFVRTDTLAGGFFSPGDPHAHYPLSPQGLRDYLSFSYTSCRFSGRRPSVIPCIRQRITLLPRSTILSRHTGEISPPR